MKLRNYFILTLALATLNGASYSMQNRVLRPEKPEENSHPILYKARFKGDAAHADLYITGTAHILPPSMIHSMVLDVFNKNKTIVVELNSSQIKQLFESILKQKMSDDHIKKVSNSNMDCYFLSHAQASHKKILNLDTIEEHQ